MSRRMAALLGTLGLVVMLAPRPATAVQCASDDDCGACAVCVAGECKGLGLIICTQDVDCGAGMACEVDPADACKNQCVDATDACATDDDCGACAVCIAGSCKGLGDVSCTQDGDCAAGKTCKVDPSDACKNQCVDATDACATDDDCGACAVCIAGSCKGLGLVICTQDADCGPGQACKVDAGAACKNACVDSAACTADDDCGACAVCVAGECKGLGLVICTQDADCGPGQACKVDAGAACKNACVAAAACTSDGDCGPCAVCVAGECKGLGLIACTTDSDCGAGRTCRVDPGAACKNTCADAGACTADADCGPCAACVAGECKGLGAVMCTKDSDCAAAQSCVVDPADACKNQCVDPDGADAGTGTGTGSGDASGAGLPDGGAAGDAGATGGGGTGSGGAGTGGGSSSSGGACTAGSGGGLPVGPALLLLVALAWATRRRRATR